MDTIKTPITSEAVTGFKRVAKHENFIIGPDLNMVQQVRIITTDETGQPLLERIQTDKGLTDSQRMATLQRYQDQLVTRQTSGAFVDITGQIVDEGTEGAISQRDFFQNITLGDLKKMGLPIGDKTPVTTLIYALIGQEITNLDKRKAL
ncbi:hypothetical protein [Spirosoma spitsbergense]|uniref:hypothetical protein n=1 Tax=Spirosoma spitsbergense TaxID=431554 RepID=UPI00037C0663|nr:hypothetical protein [Spirosoma spitsbergense]